MKQASEGIREGDVVRPTLLPGGRGPRWIWLASLVFGGVLIGFFLSEIMARLILPAPPNPWRDPPIAYITDPEIGYLHLPDQTGWIDDGFVTINSLGFRGRELEEPKPRGRFRVVVLGDSVALG